MGWASGFQAGTAMGKQWVDIYRQAEQEALMAEQKKQADLGEYQQYTPEYGKGLEAKAAEVDAQGRPLWDISIQPGSTQYQVRPIQYTDTRSEVFGGLGPVDVTTRALGEAEPQPQMATTYMGKQYAPGTLNEAEKRARQQEGYAGVYERLGRPEQAMALRNAAAKERREEEMFGLQKEAAQLQLGETKRTIQQREAGNNLSMALNELVKNKQPVTFDNMLQIGSAYGLGPAEVGKVFTDRAGINQAIYEDNKVQRAQIAQGVNTLADAEKVFNTHPLFANGEQMRYKPTGDGRVTIDKLDKTGRVIFTSPPMQEGQLLAYLKQQIMDPIAGEKFAMDVAAHNSAILKDRAMVNKLNAEAKAAGVDTKSTTGLVNFGKMLQDDITKLDTERQMLDPKKDAAVLKKNLEEREKKQAMLDVTQARIANELGMGNLRREGAPPPADGAGVTPGASLKGTVIKAGQPFNWQGKLYTLDKDILWENIQPGDLKPYSGGAAAPTPAAAPAASTTSQADTTRYIRERNPRTGGWSYSESPRGLTKQQYADIDAKAAAAKPAAPAPAPAAANPSLRVPAPPPKMITGRGVAPYPNPAYADWERKYGASWAAQNKQR